MDIDLSSPALLFPTVSLLMLAYTNRFLALAALIRNLHGDYMLSRDPLILGQIQNLRWRVWLIRNMQFLGVLTLILCVVCMLVLLAERGAGWARLAFSAALVTLLASFFFSLTEIHISVRALDLRLRDIEEEGQQEKEQ